jgi:two-component system sensor histidine kinase/response regulator
MDVQMPEMDGLEATRRLRALPGLAHTPILAMTAHAFGDDRQACLDAGMNDHLVKPIDLRQLYAALLRWLPPPQALPTPPAASPAATPAPLSIDGLDCARAMKNLGGRVEVYRRVLRQFRNHHRSGVDELSTLAAAPDPTPLQQLAHSLKGSASAVGAFALATWPNRWKPRVPTARRWPTCSKA